MSDGIDEVIEPAAEQSSPVRLEDAQGEASPFRDNSVHNESPAVQYPRPDQLRGYQPATGICPTCGRGSDEQ